MALKLITEPDVEPVTLAEAKLHLKVDIDADDALISMLISAARELCEVCTNRVFITQTWDLVLDGFPPFAGSCRTDPDLARYHPLNDWNQRHDNSVIFMPNPSLQSITSITYTDADGDSQTFASASYDVDIFSAPGRVTPVSTATWPTTDDSINCVTIRFVAGYGLASAVPKRIKEAILLTIGGWYENREQIVLKGTPKTLTWAVDALLSSVKIVTVD